MQVLDIQACEVMAGLVNAAAPLGGHVEDDVVQQCPDQPYAPYGAPEPKKPNTDLVTPRLATTTDGIHFQDMGAVHGLNDSTSVSFLGTRRVSPNGSLVKLDATHYGLFFSGGNCQDADSDAFHYIGYAESTDLVNWTSSTVSTTLSLHCPWRS